MGSTGQFSTTVHNAGIFQVYFTMSIIAVQLNLFDGTCMCNSFCPHKRLYLTCSSVSRLISVLLY